MTITIGAFSCNALTAQPFGYEGEARRGLTARTIRVAGLLTPTQWSSLLTVYNTWRTTRITDADTEKSGVVGTTVSVTVSSSNGVSVTALPCWFTEPPSGEQVGAYIQTSATLVDAAQALEVVLRQKEKDETPESRPDLGTITVGSAVITLTEPLDTRQDGPNVALTATGVSYVTGPLAAHKVRQIRGYISTGTYADVLAWYDTTIAAVPAATSWFPISPPTATAEVTVTGGVKATRYSVSLTALQIL